MALVLGSLAASTEGFIVQLCSLSLTARPSFSQLQRFKRSLSLKTILRSKSVENFFLRSGSELKCPTEVLLTPPTPLPPPSPPPASTDGSLPTPAPSPCPVQRPLAPLKPVRLHSFQEHVFKRASPCELCHQLIVGRYLGPVVGQRKPDGHLGISHGTAWCWILHAGSHFQLRLFSWGDQVSVGWG